MTQVSRNLIDPELLCVSIVTPHETVNWTS